MGENAFSVNPKGTQCERDNKRVARAWWELDCLVDSSEIRPSESDGLRPCVCLIVSSFHRSIKQRGKRRREQNFFDFIRAIGDSGY